MLRKRWRVLRAGCRCRGNWGWRLLRVRKAGKMEFYYLSISFEPPKAIRMIDWQDHIEVNPKILVGKPVIKGTRLSVEFIVERLASGWSEAEILENYPRLTKEALQAIYAYVHVLLRDSMVYSLPAQAV